MVGKKVIHPECLCNELNPFSTDCIKRWLFVSNPYDYNHFYLGICKEWLVLKARNDRSKYFDDCSFFDDVKFYVDNVIEKLVLEYLDKIFNVKIATVTHRLRYYSSSNDIWGRFIHIEVCSRPFVSVSIPFKDAIELCIDGDNYRLFERVAEEFKKYFYKTPEFKKYKTKYNAIYNGIRELEASKYTVEDRNTAITEFLIKILVINSNNKI